MEEEQQQDIVPDISDDDDDDHDLDEYAEALQVEQTLADYSSLPIPIPKLPPPSHHCHLHYSAKHLHQKLFCSECIIKQVETKIKEKMSTVSCPSLDCKGTLELVGTLV